MNDKLERFDELVNSNDRFVYHSKILLRTLMSLAELYVRNEIETHRIAT